MKYLKLLLFIFLIACSAQSSWATHNRAGEILYKYIGNGVNLTYEFTIVTYTKRSGPSISADRPRLEIDYGDGTIDSIDRVSQVLIEGVESDFSDIYKNEYVGVHTFPGPFTYVVSFVDRNRVDDIINIGGSVDIPFSVSDTVKILDPTFFGFNSSPILLQPPIDNATIGFPFKHNPNAFDIDGDSLSYQLIVPAQSPGIAVPAYAFPDQIAAGANNNITINQATGEITWDSPQQIGLYNIAILISEFRNGICVGTLVRDMQIRVEEAPNTPPIVEGPTEVCVVAGDTLEFPVRAFDNDNPTQLVELTAGGSPFVVDDSPAEFSPQPLIGNPVEGDFYWETNCSHIRSNNYQVIFRAEDDFSDFPLSTILTTVIRVLAPAPEDVTGFYDGTQDAVVLNWSADFDCRESDLFRGYQVWRKVGCEGDPQDSCGTDLAQRGYVLLGETTNTTFTDNDFIRGNEYSYRIVARFATLSQVGNIELNPFTGFPSEEFCIEFPKEIPVMYNADVRATDETNGQIFVAWSTPKPEDIDSFVAVNPGPYVFQLNRAEGIGNTTGTVIATFTENSLTDLLDTTFLDENLNTVANGYTYWIEFLVRGDELLGSAAPASSIYLSLTPRDQSMILDWNFNVPWVNDTFIVYRQDFEIGDFNLIDTVLAAANNTRVTYRDEGLINDSTYCYKVLGIGAYTAEGFSEPLLNFSQEVCEIPNDTIPPCEAILDIRNFCLDETLPEGEFIDYLTWTFADDCPQPDDYVEFYIYYAPTTADSLVIIDTVQSLSFNHIRLDSSLTGCYAVRGIDGAGNLAEVPQRKCVEDCPNYELPTAFTPNGDNDNDIYTPIIPYRLVQKIDMKIYNRWGNLVFETEDPNINWDGRDQKNDKELDTGVFFYTCTLFINSLDGLRKIEEPLEGYIHLYR